MFFFLENALRKLVVLIVEMGLKIIKKLAVKLPIQKNSKF